MRVAAASSTIISVTSTSSALAISPIVLVLPICEPFLILAIVIVEISVLAAAV